MDLQVVDTKVNHMNYAEDIKAEAQRVIDEEMATLQQKRDELQDRLAKAQQKKKNFFKNLSQK